ncbi:MAG: delta-60 repeat domain-containing protein, partial [Acidobacteriota bacterium]|nr:delta-60 repeat domain-containing protein [Acidobacteriota bacterium]
MNKIFVSLTNAPASFAGKLLTLSFSAALFSFITLCGWQPALSQTRAAFPVSQTNSTENTPVSPRLARSPQAEFIDAAPDKRTETRRDALAADGDIDASFNAGVSEGFGFIEETIVQPDGKIIIGGSFKGVNGAPRNFLARLNADGSTDATFNPGGVGPSANVLALARQPDGKILIGGNGALYNGAFRGFMTRLNADGTPDLTFNAGSSANSTVESIAVQADGRILVGGFFSTFNGVPRSRIARLNPDGSLDASFNPGSGFNNPVFSIVPQPDGKILVGGAFRSYNGAAVFGIARLNLDGSLDTTFNPGGTGASSTVETIVLQPDGKILVGGFFSSFNGTPTLGIVRLNADGTVDTAITVPGIVSGMVSAIALQTSGKILVGGAFFDGTTVSRGTARFNADGSLDFLFRPNETNGDIFSIVIQPDGKILVGGSFTRIDG